MKIVSWFEPLVEHLWGMRAQVLCKEEDQEFNFDYPDYGGLPKKISNKLSSEIVDVIQDELLSWHENNTTKKQFMREVAAHLSRDTIV